MRVSLSLSARRLMLAVCSVLVVGLFVGVAPGLAVNLPDGRVYEEVTPVHMNGARALPYVVSGSGEKVLFLATSAFAGRSGGNGNVPYQSYRTPTGWRTFEPLPPAGEYHYGTALLPFIDTSSDLSKDFLFLTLFPFRTNLEVVSIYSHGYIQEANPGPDGSAVTSETDTLPQTGVFAGETPVNLNLPYNGGSPDLSHLVFEQGYPSSTTFLLEDDLSDPSSPRYKFVDIAGPGNPDGSGTHMSECGAKLGSGISGGLRDSFLGGYGRTPSHAISADGSIVFFTANACGFSSGKEGPSSNELLARVNGSETIPISEPSLESCPGFLSGKVNFQCRNAEFAGASVDGSKVFFTSPQSEEVPGVTDTTVNIYEAEVGGTSTKSVTKLVQLSAGDTSGEGARVQGVVRISDDGSHVYFVAQGVLSSAPGPEGDVAQNGADNLYVSIDGSIKFIGELCSDHDLSGQLADPHCPAADNLWESDDHAAWSAPFGSANSNGRYLVFDTVAQLINTGPEADTDTALDVYEYDSQTNKLVRISTGRNGFDDNGNNSDYAATIPNADYADAGARASAQSNSTESLGWRPVSNDGSFVFFTTSEALQPDDANGAPDVYEWHDGLVSLISDGQNPGVSSNSTEATANVFIGTSADGRDAFFTTPDTLVPEGGDSPGAIYDARIDGGFPQAIVPPPCREDACQGTISPTPSFPSPSSALYDSGGNLTLPVVKPAVKAKPKKTVRKKAKHKKRGKAKAGKHSKKGRK